MYIYIYTANTTLTAKGYYSCFMQDLTELMFLCLIKLQVPHMKTPGQLHNRIIFTLEIREPS